MSLTLLKLIGSNNLSLYEQDIERVAAEPHIFKGREKPTESSVQGVEGRLYLLIGELERQISLDYQKVRRTLLPFACINTEDLHRLTELPRRNAAAFGQSAKCAMPAPSWSGSGGIPGGPSL